MEEYQDRRIEQFFHKKYAQPITPETWNTPDDAVWEHIEAHLPRSKRRRGCWFWLFNGSLVILCSSLIGFAAFSSVVFPYTASKQPVESTQKSQQAVSSVTLKTTQTPEKVPQLTFSSPYSAWNFSTSSYFPNKASFDSFSTKKKQFLPQNSIESNADATLLSSYPSSDSPLRINPVDKSEICRQLPMVVIPIPLRASQTHLPGVSFPANVDQTGSPTAISIPKWQLSASIWRQQWQQIRRGRLSAPLSELLKEEDLIPSWSVGVDIQRRLTPSWSIRTGMVYIRQQHTSKYLLQVPYTLSTEQPGTDGHIDNHFAHTLPSETGSVHTDLILRRNAHSLVHDQEIVDINFSFQRNLTWLNVPLQVVWEPQVLKGVYFMGGGSMALRLTDHLSITEAQSLHTYIYGKSVQITPASNAPRWMPQLSGGIGYRRPLNRQWQFKLDVQYLRSLSSLYQQNGFSYHSHLFQAGVGMCKSW